METLNEIGLKHKTDKASTTHGYLDNYAKYLESWRNKKFVLLEIGVASGASIKMWREYFPNAKVYGIDNNPDCAGEGIFIGSQTDVEFLNKVFAEIGAPDIIIDDGSHVGQDMVDTFRMLFSIINSGGYYILEDTHCIYSEHYSGAFQSNGRTLAYNYFSDMPYHVDVAGRAMTGNAQYAIDSGIQDPPVPEFSRLLSAIHIHPSVRIFERR